MPAPGLPNETALNVNTILFKFLAGVRFFLVELDERLQTVTGNLGDLEVSGLADKIDANEKSITDLRAEITGNVHIGTIPALTPTVQIEHNLGTEIPLITVVLPFSETIKTISFFAVDEDKTEIRLGVGLLAEAEVIFFKPGL